MKQKKVLVTGGAGFIGRNLSRFLRQQGWLVNPLDSLSVTPLRPAPRGLWHADVLDITPGDLADIDIVVHFAAHKNVPNSFTASDEATRNIEQDKHLLRVCSSARVPKVVLASSCEVYGRQNATYRLNEQLNYNPMSPYAVSKVALEMHANIYRQLTSDTKFTCVRFFNVYGPDEGRDAVVPRFVQDILSTGHLTIEGSGAQRRDFSYIDDVVTVLGELLLIDDLPNIINIGSGETYSVNELAAMIIEKNGEGVIRHKPERPNEIQSFCADTTLLETVLGHTMMRTSFSDGIQRCIDETRLEAVADDINAALQ